MTEDASAVESPERRRKRRRRADPSPHESAAIETPQPDGDMRMNPLEIAGAVQKDPSPSAVTDDAQRFELVRQRAYELYLRRGAGFGDDFTDWLEAERQIDAERSR